MRDIATEVPTAEAVFQRVPFDRSNCDLSDDLQGFIVVVRFRTARKAWSEKARNSSNIWRIHRCGRQKCDIQITVFAVAVGEWQAADKRLLSVPFFFRVFY
jgi:hypothetical protein